MSTDAQEQAAIRAFGFVRNRGGDVTEAIRAALAAAQAPSGVTDSAPYEQGLAVGIAAAAKVADARAKIWKQAAAADMHTNCVLPLEEECEDIAADIRALRPPAAPAECTWPQCEAPLNEECDRCPTSPRRSASEPAGPSEQKLRAAVSKFIDGRMSDFHDSREVDDDLVELASALSRPPPSAFEPAALKGKPLEIDREWCIDAANRESDGEVGVGLLARDPELTGPSEEDVARVLDKAAYLAQASRRAMRDHGGAEKFLDLNASVAAFEKACVAYLALLQRSGR